MKPPDPLVKPVRLQGFPEGNARLERDSAFYNAAYYSPEKKPLPWNRDTTRTVCWYPALALVRGPVFDVGCGGGQFAAMCEAYGVSCVRGIDSSFRAVEQAKELGLKTEFVTDSAFNATDHFYKDDYTTATFLEVLEHVYDDLHLMALVPSGKTVVGSVPSFHTNGHCRWFGNRAEVRDRYRVALHIDRVVTEQAVSSKNRWFIFRGKRL